MTIKPVLAFLAFTLSSWSPASPNKCETPSAESLRLETLIWTTEPERLALLEPQAVRLIQNDPHSTYGFYLVSVLSSKLFIHHPEEPKYLLQASDLADHALELAQNCEYSQIAKANILMLMGHLDEASALLRIGIKQTPQSWRLAFALARLSENFDSDAEDLLRRALASEGSREILVPYLVTQLQEGFQEDEQIRHFVRWNRDFPHHAFDLAMANYYFENGWFTEARSLYIRTLQKNPKSVEALISSALLDYEKFERYSLAQEKLNKALQHSTDNKSLSALILSHLGSISLNQKQPDAARSHFVKAFVSGGDDLASSILGFIRATYKEAKKPEELVRLLETLSFESPGKDDIYGTLGETLSKDLNKHQEAAQAFVKAIALGPDRSEWYNSLGLTYYRMNDYAGALSLFTKAVTINPDDASARYNQACAYSILGRFEEALTSLQGAVELNPTLIETAKIDNDFIGIKNSSRFRLITEVKPEL